MGLLHYDTISLNNGRTFGSIKVLKSLREARHYARRLKGFETQAVCIKNFRFVCEDGKIVKIRV